MQIAVIVVIGKETGATIVATLGDMLRYSWLIKTGQRGISASLDHSRHEISCYSDPEDWPKIVLLPEVGSTITPPNLSAPDFSAASTIDSAMRSLIEPPGLLRSDLIHA